MPYCTITEVQGQNPKRTYSATSTPTTTQVTEFVTQIANEIDSILLGMGITVPVTTPTELVGFLELLNAYGAAALAEMAMFPESTGPGASVHGQQLYTMYQAGLKRLEGMSAAGGGVVTGHVPPASFFLERALETTTPTRDNIWQDPKFKKGMEF